MGVAFALIWWRGPGWATRSRDAFTAVSWEWVVGAIALNLLSVVVRAIAWTTVIRIAMPPPHPRDRTRVLGVLGRPLRERGAPGRDRRARARRRPRAASCRGGEGHDGDARRHGARAPRLRYRSRRSARHLRAHHREGARVGDHVAGRALVGIGIGLFIVALVARAPITASRARRASGAVRLRRAGAARARRDAHAARHGAQGGLVPVSWLDCQLFAVWAAMRAFHIDEPLPAAGRRARADERRHDLPVLAGQHRPRAARDRDLARRTTASTTRRGIAFGIGLQAIEASVGIGIGLIFLAREGLSDATLKQIEERSRRDVRVTEEEEPDRVGSRVSG